MLCLSAFWQRRWEQAANFAGFQTVKSVPVGANSLAGFRSVLK